MHDLAKKLANMSPERQKFTLEVLPAHLVDAQQGNRLKKLLTSFDFLLAKVRDYNPNSLIDDYELALSSEILVDQDAQDSLRLIQDTIRLSAHILEVDHTQLPGQLLGRLSRPPIKDGFRGMYLPLFERQFKKKDDGILNLLNEASEWRGASWLHPISSSLVSSNNRLLIRTLYGHDDGVSWIAVTPDGKLLLSASADNTIKVWDIATFLPLRTLKGHIGGVNRITITSNGQFMLSASSDKTVKVWEIATGQEIHTLEGHNKPVIRVITTRDGQLALSTSSDRTIKVWEIATGQEIHTLEGHTWGAPEVAVTPDNKFAFSISEGVENGVNDSGGAYAWDLKEGRQIKYFGTRYFDLSITSDSRFALLAGGKEILIWDIEKGQRYYSLNGKHKVETTPDSKFALFATPNDAINLWNIEDNRKVRTFKGNKHQINEIKVTRDGQFVFITSLDGTIKIWNIKTGKLIQTIPSSTHCFTITPDNKLLFTVSSDAKIKVWELSNCGA